MKHKTLKIMSLCLLAIVNINVYAGRIDFADWKFENLCVTNWATDGLYVPVGAEAAYEAANYWKEFKEIIEIEAPSPTITFADDAVKAICVANWDTNGDGELSMDEATAVTDLRNVFSQNTEITSFDELEYFTGLTYIWENAFSWCSNLRSVKLPNNVKYIDDEAFYLCENLSTVNLPSSLIEIGKQAFCYCKNLETLDLPNHLTSIGDCAFEGCEKLTTLTIPGNVETIGGKSFRLGKNIENLVISEGVKYIGGGAFEGLETITSVNIPKSVTEINYIYGNPFGYCRNLKTITVDEDNPNYESKNNSLIEKSTNTLIAASNNTTIPNSIKTIGPNAFYGLPIETIEIPTSVTKIGNAAFKNCEELVSISIPSSVTQIDGWAFDYCPKLESIKLSSGLEVIGESAFWTCST